MRFITIDNLKVMMHSIVTLIDNKANKKDVVKMTTSDLVDDMVSEDMLDVVSDHDGSILTDNNDILIW